MIIQKWTVRLAPNLAINEINDCPNCWGYSRWDTDKPSRFDLDKGQCTEINSRNGFIRRFVKKYIG